MNTNLPELVGTLANLPVHARKAIEEYGKACANVAVKQYKESLVVELPKTQDHKKKDQLAITNMKSGFNVCIGEIKQSLQSAGINYREKE